MIISKGKLQLDSPKKIDPGSQKCPEQRGGGQFKEIALIVHGFTSFFPASRTFSAAISVILGSKLVFVVCLLEDKIEALTSTEKRQFAWTTKLSVKFVS